MYWPSEDVGTSDKVPLSPTDEEGDEPQRPGKEHADPETRSEGETIALEEELTVQETNIELHQTGHESDDSHIFSNLSGIMITSTELFKDHASRPSSPGFETSPVILLSPQAKELTPGMKAATTPKSKSGLLHNASSLHFAHT